MHAATEPLLVANPIGQHVLHVGLLQVCQLALDLVPALLGHAGLPCRHLDVAGGARPVARDRLGVERDLEVVLLGQAHHDVAADPEVVPGLHPRAGAHGVGPLARDRILGVCWIGVQGNRGKLGRGEEQGAACSPEIWIPAWRQARRCASARSLPGEGCSWMGPTAEPAAGWGTPLQDQPSGQPDLRFIIKYSCWMLKTGSLDLAASITTSQGALWEQCHKDGRFGTGMERSAAGRNSPVVREVRPHLQVGVVSRVDDRGHHGVAQNQHVLPCGAGPSGSDQPEARSTALGSRRLPCRNGSLKRALGRRMMSPSPWPDSQLHHSISSTLWGLRERTLVLLCRSVPEEPRYTYSHRT